MTKLDDLERLEQESEDLHTLLIDALGGDSDAVIILFETAQLLLSEKRRELGKSA